MYTKRHLENTIKGKQLLFDKTVCSLMMDQ